MPKIRTASDYKRGELSAKDLSSLREADSALQQHDMNFGYVRDYSLSHRIKLKWDLGEEAMRDRIFELQIDDYSVLIDAEEILRLIRWV